MSQDLYTPIPDERGGLKWWRFLSHIPLYFLFWLVIAADIFASLLLGGLSEPDLRPCVTGVSSSWQVRTLFFLPLIAGPVIQILALFLTWRGDEKVAIALVAVIIFIFMTPAVSIIGWPREMKSWIPIYSYSGCS